jgi:hypothetical protein
MPISFMFLHLPERASSKALSNAVTFGCMHDNGPKLVLAPLPLMQCQYASVRWLLCQRNRALLRAVSFAGAIRSPEVALSGVSASLKDTFSGAPGFKTGGAAATPATGFTLWTAGVV